MTASKALAVRDPKGEVAVIDGEVVESRIVVAPVVTFREHRFDVDAEAIGARLARELNEQRVEVRL